MPRHINIGLAVAATLVVCAAGAAAQTAAPAPPTPLAPAAAVTPPAQPAAKAPPAAASNSQAKPQPAAAPAPAPPAPKTFIKPVVINPEDLRFLNAQADFHAHNYARAYLELLPMANNGDARAEFLLGEMSDNGLGPVQLDVQEAARWYQRAADKNSADAQFALANAYSIGRGVPVSPQDAMKWLTLAGSNGHVTAMMSLAGLYETGVAEVRDPAKAADWTLRAARAGSVNALYLYGVRLIVGDGVQQDPKMAALWFVRAAQRGHPAAALMLGKLVGDGLKASPEQDIEAYMWLTLAARRGQGQVQSEAAQALRRLQPNMMPSDVQTAVQRVAAWKPMPQFAGLQPDPEYDLPGGLNSPLPPQPKNAAQGAKGSTTPARAGSGGG